MSDSGLNCPKCSSEMEGGFIADYNNHSELRASDWVEGEPVKSFWYGTEIKGKVQYRVRAYRCARCGFLESYATETPEKRKLFG